MAYFLGFMANIDYDHGRATQPISTKVYPPMLANTEFQAHIRVH